MERRPGWRFFFALINLARRVSGIDFFERPLLIGLFAGFVSNEWEALLPLALFFELYWLDILPMGIYIPPLSYLAFILSMCIAMTFNISTPDFLAVPMVMAMACAYMGAIVEFKLRGRLDVYMESLERWSAEGDAGHDVTAKIAIKALLVNFFSKLILFGICFALIFGALGWFKGTTGELPRIVGLNWHILIIVAAMGGLLALRIKNAYGAFIVTAGGLAVYTLL